MEWAEEVLRAADEEQLGLVEFVMTMQHPGRSAGHKHVWISEEFREYVCTSPMFIFRIPNEYLKSRNVSECKNSSSVHREKRGELKADSGRIKILKGK